MRQAAPRLRHPGMVRNPVGGLQPKKLPQGQRVRASPFDPALAVDPLEIPDHVHAKVAAWRHRGCAHRAGVVRSAGVLHEAVEPGCDQHLLQAVVENVGGRARHLGPHHHQLALTIALPTHRHSQTPTRSLAKSSQIAPTSSTGCYVSGLSMNRTAKLLGVSTPTVQAWLEQAWLEQFAAAYAQKPEPE